jgi:hypothetical protein
MKSCLPFIVIIFLSLSSCREDIINPENTGGDINEPVELSTSSGYVYSINGANVSYSAVYSPIIISVDNNINLNLNDYTSGNIYVTLLDPDNVTIFFYNLSNNLKDSTISLPGQEIDKIKFSFNNFTGKFRFEIAPTD